jgi:hypothetical protein
MRLDTLASVVALVSTTCSALHTAEQQPLIGVEQIASADKLNLTHDLVAFHKGLVEIESITGNEEAVGEWLADSLQSQGYTVEKQYLSKNPARFNVLAWPGAQRNARVIFSSHIDTVSPSISLINHNLQTSHSSNHDRSRHSFPTSSRSSRTTIPSPAAAPLMPRAVSLHKSSR